MSENLKKFLESVSGEGQEMIEKVNGADKDTLIALAAERGITLTDADFVQAQPDGELSDDELDAVAGGGICACVIGGGGVSGESYRGTDKTCACVIAGFGDGEYAESSRTHVRCVCDIGGAGDTYL